MFATHFTPHPFFFAFARPPRGDDDCCGPRPPRPPPWFHGMMGPGPRAERGEVRYLVLDALKERPRHGYEVIQHIEERSEGRYRPSPGTVYPTLQMLEELGHVRCQEEGGKKIYALTDEGRGDLDAHTLEVEEAYGRFGWGHDWMGGLDLPALGLRVRRIVHGIGAGLRRGRLTQADLQEVKRQVDEALDRIEKFVAERLK